MKLNKEYPATHSMSTSWYIVDDDGNLGLLDYDENGPVPWGIEQTCCEELGFGHWDDWKNKIITRFNLTDEQILDMFYPPHSPEQEEHWSDCAVKIDKAKKERFLELSQNQDISDFWCISENLGLYGFDAFNCCVFDKDYNITSIKDPLKAMIPLVPKRLPTIKTTQDFIGLFSATKGWLNKTVKDINPYAIIVSDDAIDIISLSTKISGNSIEFGGVAYPLYKLSEIDKHTEEIKEYNKLPFRGQKYPQVISEDDMDDLINSGQARDYYY